VLFHDVRPRAEESTSSDSSTMPTGSITRSGDSRTRSVLGWRRGQIDPGGTR
jgi:hypothetical protein